MQYQGQIVDGQMHGSGKLIYENSEFYDGDWVRGKLHYLCPYVNVRLFVN